MPHGRLPSGWAATVGRWGPSLLRVDARLAAAAVVRRLVPGAADPPAGTGSYSHQYFTKIALDAMERICETPPAFIGHDACRCMP